MSNVIVRHETIMKMFPRENLGKITTGITVAIDKSLKEQNMRNPTTGEIRRRFDICMKWATELRGDLGWGVQHIVDELPNILRLELLGQTYTPPKREIWAPDTIPALV